MSNSFNQAVVLGGSVAGLLAARVLATHFQQVTIIERDKLPQDVAPRAGTPQDQHIHILLERGASILQTLFPGIDEQLQAAGAHIIDLGHNMRTQLEGRWVPRYVCGRQSYASSRVLLESAIRRRVTTLPNVTLFDNATVNGLVAQNGRIIGVSVRQRGDANAIIKTADFVVDATGRYSKTPEWLTKLGYDPPTETVIDPQLGYATRRYRPPKDHTYPWHVMLIGAYAPHKTRGGTIYTLENGDWLVSLSGILGDYPPTQEEAFLTFAQTIDPEFFTAVQAATPIGKIKGFQRTENRWRHYEQCKRWPDGLIVVGDAACGFNPIYGQGVTVAAMAAEALAQTFQKWGNRPLTGLAKTYQKKYAQVVEPAWLLSSSSDLVWLGRGAATNAAERFAGWYMPKVLSACISDLTVHRALMGVLNLSEPLTKLFHPPIFARVLRHAWQTRKVPKQPYPATYSLHKTG